MFRLNIYQMLKFMFRTGQENISKFFWSIYKRIRHTYPAYFCEVNYNKKFF